MIHSPHRCRVCGMGYELGVVYDLYWDRDIDKMAVLQPEKLIPITLEDYLAYYLNDAWPVGLPLSRPPTMQDGSNPDNHGVWELVQQRIKKETP